MTCTKHGVFNASSSNCSICQSLWDYDALVRVAAAAMAAVPGCPWGAGDAELIEEAQAIVDELTNEVTA
jgi:hypothetical protein